MIIHLPQEHLKVIGKALMTLNTAFPEARPAYQSLVNARINSPGTLQVTPEELKVLKEALKALERYYASLENLAEEAAITEGKSVRLAHAALDQAAAYASQGIEPPYITSYTRRVPPT